LLEFAIAWPFLNFRCGQFDLRNQDIKVNAWEFLKLRKLNVFSLESYDRVKKVLHFLSGVVSWSLF
jgi:hypothetical protein